MTESIESMISISTLALTPALSQRMGEGEESSQEESQAKEITESLPQPVMRELNPTASPTGAAPEAALAHRYTEPPPLPDIEEDGPLVMEPAEAAPAFVGLRLGKPDLQGFAVSERRILNAQRRQDAITTYNALLAEGQTPKKAGRAVGVSPITIWRWERQLCRGSLQPNTHLCGAKPKYMPSEAELALVRKVWLPMDHNKFGGSDIAAFRLVACSADACVTEAFRQVVLKRKSKTLPPSWRRLLDAPQAVVQVVRDPKSLTLSHISTPRNRTYVDEQGIERPLEVATIFESDDGTVNFPCCVPWPFGGDPCSEKFGVKVARFQLLPIVDVHSLFCPLFHFVVRPKSSYRGEDAAALFGDTFQTVDRPKVARLERGSWESALVKDALKLAGVPTFHAWLSKQKAAVENFFDRLWTPTSLIPGHVGRDRDRYTQVTDLLLSCQAARKDPRDHFIMLPDAIRRIAGAVSWVNSELVKSPMWGQWIPQQRWEQGYTGARRMQPEMAIFFAREQHCWTVRKNLVGGNVAGPLVSFPVYFQCSEMWEFEGCKVKCFFDPYQEPCLGTLVLQDEWRGHKPGYVIARDVPALELPPQIVLAADGWEGQEKHERSLAVRKAIAKAVRTESWNWRGIRRSEARDGLGNVSEYRSDGVSALTSSPAHQPTGTTPSTRLTAPARQPALPPITDNGRNRLARQAQHAANLQAMQTET